MTQTFRATLAALSGASLIAATGAEGGTNFWSGGGPGEREVAIVALDPATPDTVYAGTDGGLFRSTDGGEVWTPTALEEAFVPFAALLAVPGPPTVLYAAGDFGVRRSADAGASWESADAGISSRYVRALAADPGRPRTLYAGTYRISGTIPSGIFKTTDGGASWEITGLSNSHDVAAIAVDPSDSDVVFAVDRSRLVRSLDGGESWAPVEGVPSFDTAHAVIAVGTASGGSVYAAVGDTVYRSSDRGETWQGGGAGLLGRAVALAADPLFPQTVYAGTDSGVFKSTTGGAQWAALRPLPEGGVRHLALDPLARRRLAVATPAGVYSLTQDRLFDCTGDCDGDDAITVSDLLRAVTIVLGAAPEVCPAYDRSAPLSIADLIGAVRGSLDGCLPASHVETFADFERFELTRHSALGFCPPLGVFSATLTRQPNGETVFEHTVLEEGVAGIDPCLPGFFGATDCATERERPVRSLEVAEIDDVHAAFARVLVHDEADRRCRHVVFDPCLVNVFAWDDFQGTDFICGDPRIDDRHVGEILALLDMLSAPPPAAGAARDYGPASN